MELAQKKPLQILVEWSNEMCAGSGVKSPILHDCPHDPAVQESEVNLRFEDCTDKNVHIAHGRQHYTGNRANLWLYLRRHDANFKLIAGVNNLAKTKFQQKVKTNAADIETVISIDRNLALVFWIIALAGMAGFSLSLGASLWANIDRKRRDLSVLRLVGYAPLGVN